MRDPIPLSWGLAGLAERASAHAGYPLDADDCDDDDLIAAATESATALAERRWHRAVPQAFHRVHLDDPQLRQAAGDGYDDLVTWAHTPWPPNLVLLGPVGVGKSAAACAACRPACDRGVEVRFWSIAEALQELRPGGPDDTWAALVDVERLILDDLGTEKVSEWTAAQVYALINRRWMDERPVVATSNLDAASLSDHIGERAFSRLIGGDALVIRLAGPDRRRHRR